MYQSAIETSKAKPVPKKRCIDMRAASVRELARIPKTPKAAPKSAAFSDITPDYVDQFVQKMDALTAE